MVGVAQLVEHLVVVQDVAGSSPVTHPKVRCRPRPSGWPWRSVQQYVFSTSLPQCPGVLVFWH